MKNIDYDKIEICLDSSFSNEERAKAMSEAFNHSESEDSLGLVKGFWDAQLVRLESDGAIIKKARDILESYLDE